MGINTSYSNYYNGMATTQQTTKKAETSHNAEAPQTLDDFKREIYDTINKMPVHPSQAETQIAINISDKAFEKMMNDPEYKDLMLKTIQRDLNGAYPAAAAPSYMVIRIGDDCEYLADSMGSAYGGYFSGFSSTSFMEKNTKKASSDYDDFNHRKNVENTSYQDIVEKKLLEKRFQEKQLLEIKYAEEVLANRSEQSAQREMALAAYEHNTFFVTPEG